MSKFLSWIEHKGKLYYLTKAILNSRKGKILREYCGWDDDLTGHGAIRWYYNLKAWAGINKECTDFSSPRNFPREIAEAIKRGLFEGMGIPLQILTPKALAEYEKAIQSPWVEYENARQSARNKKHWECEKIIRSALNKFGKINQSTFWSLVKNPENRVDVWK